MADQQLYRRFGKEFPKGTVLFHEGEPGSVMYVIQEGKVRISVTVRKVEKVLVDLPTGEFFGEMSILNGQPRSATATVVEDAKLLVIDPKTFEAMVRGSGEIAIRMIKKLAARLQEADDQIANLLLKDHTSRVVHRIISMSKRGQVKDGVVQIETDFEDLGIKLGLDVEQVASVFDRLKSANLVFISDVGIKVPSPEKLQEFLAFLAMKEKFGNI